MTICFIKVDFHMWKSTAVLRDIIGENKYSKMYRIIYIQYIANALNVKYYKFR